MLTTALTIAFCLIAPLGVMWLTHRSTLLRRVGDIIIAYVIGCAAGLSGLIPPEASQALTIMATISIPFAIPLMLMSSDVRAWAHLAPQFAKSMATGVGGCIIAIVVGFLLFGQDDAETNSKIGGMLTGLYTGGTANQASLKMALDIPDDVYLLSHSYSILVSAIYLIFIIVFGQKTLTGILPRFKHEAQAVGNNSADSYGNKNGNSAENCTEKYSPAAAAHSELEDHSGELFYGLFRRDNLPHLGRAMLITLGILAAGGLLAVGLQSVVEAAGSSNNVFQAVFILAISLITAVVATNKKARGIKRTYEAGTFFILIFSIAVSSQVNTSMFNNINGSFFAFITTATLGALFFHVLLSALMRIDVDTTLTVSASLICSPPFVPVMAGALDNKAVIGPGIAVGLIGYATGTYIGFIVAKGLALLI